MKPAGGKARSRFPPPDDPQALLRSGLVKWALITWAALAFLNYIAAHPFSSDAILSVTLAPLLSVSFLDLLTPLGPAALAAILLIAQAAAALALGLRVTAWFCPAMESRPERIFFSLLAGLGIISLFELGAGLAGFFRTELFALILGFAAACFRDAWVELRKLFAESKPGKLPAWALLGLGAVLVIQVGSLISGFTPPHISDEQTYHLATAKWYLELGKIAFWPSNVYIFYPQMDTMLYAPYISLGLLYGIKWLHWAAGLLGGWGLWLILEKVPRPIRIGALLFYFTIPAVWIVAGRAFNDLLILAYAAGALLAALRARNLPGRPGLLYALLAGACVGFAASNKYNGLLLGILLLPFLNFTRLLAAGTAAAVVFSPWLIKNWLWLGNPLFPYFWRFLGGLGWDEHLAWRYKKKLLQADTTFGRKLFEVPALPWNLPIKDLGSGTHSNTGPLIVIGIPLLFLSTGTFGMFGLAALVGFFLPTVFRSIGTRYLIPALPLMILLGAERFRSFAVLWRRRGLLAAGFVMLLFYQASGYSQTSWKDYDDPLRLIFGGESLPKYLRPDALPAPLLPLFLFPHAGCRRKTHPPRRQTAVPRRLRRVVLRPAADAFRPDAGQAPATHLFPGNIQPPGNPEKIQATGDHPRAGQSKAPRHLLRLLEGLGLDRPAGPRAMARFLGRLRDPRMEILGSFHPALPFRCPPGPASSGNAGLRG